MSETSGPRYVPEDSLKTPRFTGIRTFARLPSRSDAGGRRRRDHRVPFDTGVSYRAGGRLRPERHPGGRPLMLRPYNPAQEVNPFEVLSCVDYGDVPIVPGLHRAQLRGDRAGAHARGRGGGHPAAHRRGPLVHAAAPARHPVEGSGGGHHVRLAHRRVGLVTSARSTPTAPGCAGRSRRGWSTPPTRSRSGCAARLRPADWTVLNDELGLDYVPTVDLLRRDRRDIARIREPRRRPPGLHQLRHRRRGSGVRPGHRHAEAGGLVGPGAGVVRACAASTSSASTSSR